MAAYYDGVIAAGTYWVNGSSGASQLSASTTPTAAAAAADAIDWDANTETTGLTIGDNPSGATGYSFGAGCAAGPAPSTTCASTTARSPPPTSSRSLTAINPRAARAFSPSRER